MVVYPRSGQKIFFQRETKTYGEPYSAESDLTAFTILKETYPHWRRMDLIPDSADIIVPLIEKLKMFDIGDAKHPSAIFSGNIKPVEFTIDMNAQALEFLPFAIGAPAVTSHKRKFECEITCVADASKSLHETYFMINGVNAGGTIEQFVVWFDVGTGGSAPTIAGIADANRLEVELAENADAATVQAAVMIKITTEAEFVDNTSAGAIVKLIAANEGAVTPTFDSGVAPTGFTFKTTVYGSTDYAVVEAIDYNLPSFTIHVEQAHGDTEAEDIVWDLFGCVVQEITVDVNYGNSIVTASVTFACPYALENSNGICDNPPPRKLIAAFPSMTALQESASNYVIMEGTTDRTPETVDKVSLTIRNNVKFQSDIAKRYGVLAVAGTREISMNVVGSTAEKELFTYYQGLYTHDGTDWTPTAASGKLNTKFKLQRNATYDYILISVYNWLLEEHDFVFVSVDDAVKSVDITFTDGSADTNGRLIDDMDFVSCIDGATMVRID